MSIYVCDYGHDDIAYSDNRCPLCEANKLIDDLRETIADLEAEIENLEIRLEEKDHE